MSKAAINAGIDEQLGLQRMMGEVKNCRSIRKSDMVHNSWQPEIEVDPQT